MSEEEIMNKIVEMVTEKFDVEDKEITKDTNFKDDLDADSIDLVEFSLELEDEFGSDITDEDAENITTVGEAVDYIKKNQ